MLVLGMNSLADEVNSRTIHAVRAVLRALHSVKGRGPDWHFRWVVGVGSVSQYSRKCFDK